MSDTPRTSALILHGLDLADAGDIIKLCRQLERELAALSDHPIARLQVGPDGVVPTGTIDALELWKAEADRLWTLLAAASETRPSLSAAAPELLAALERIVQLNDRMPEDHPSRLSHGEEQQARAAIKKARAE